MIARISGILVEKSVTHCIVDVQGTGYRIFTPLSTFYELPDIDQAVVLRIHTHVREDAISLYGFLTETERAVFQMMISVSGIGPRLAVNILSGITAGEWIQAVAGENLRRLTGIPGVGKKTAERMILELKDKVAGLERAVPAAGAAPAGTGERMKEDALSALVNLGYRASVGRETLDRIAAEAQEPLPLDLLLKKALRSLAG